MTKHNNFTSDLLANTMEFHVTLEPAFETKLKIEEPVEQTLHRVMSIFTEYFGSNSKCFSDNNFVGLENW
jgi:hypothetical protein